MRKILSAGIIMLLLIAVSTLVISGCGKEKEKTPKDEIKGLHGRLLFESPLAITEPGNFLAPSLALDSEGNAHIAYLLQMENTHRAYITSSSDFSHTTQLSDRDGNMSNGLALHSSGDSMWAVWINKSESSAKMIFKRSANLGRNFTRETVFNGAKEPYRLAITGGESSLLTFYMRREKKGAQLVLNTNFDPASESALIKSDNLRGLRAVTGTNGTYVICVDRSDTANGGKFILLKTSDGGKSFNTYDLFNAKLFPLYRNIFEVTVSTTDETDTLHMIWLERDGAGVKLLYSHTEDAITKWSQPIEVASAEKSENWICYRPLLVSDGLKSILIAYAYLNRSDDEGYRMAYKVSEDIGVTFMDESIITTHVTSPEIITGAISRQGVIHLAWDDEDYTNPGDRRIYYIRGSVR